MLAVRNRERRLTVPVSLFCATSLNAISLELKKKRDNRQDCIFLEGFEHQCHRRTYRLHQCTNSRSSKEPYGKKEDNICGC